MSESLYVKKEVNQQEYRQKNNDSRMHFYNPILQRELSQKSKLPDEQIYTAQLYSIGDTLDDSGNEEDLTDQPNLTGIPIYLKQHYEEQFGFSFDDVRVHYNSDKPAKLQALAYAQGNQVYMGPGQEIHLEHELGHVVQDKNRG